MAKNWTKNPSIWSHCSLSSLARTAPRHESTFLPCDQIWRNFAVFGKNFKHLWHLVLFWRVVYYLAKFEPTLANVYAIGQILLVVNSQILKKYASLLVTLPPSFLPLSTVLQMKTKCLNDKLTFSIDLLTDNWTFKSGFETWAAIDIKFKGRM